MRIVIAGIQMSTSRQTAISGAILSILGFWLVWHYGHRGLMILDHSIIFDGGYRVYLGQTMYKDFYAAYLPGVFWIQAMAFRLFGVNFSAMVLPAAICNALGVALVVRIIWRLIPGHLIPPILGGLLTCVWFQTPYGAVMHEGMAFFCTLSALWLLVDFRSFASHFLAGLCLFAAVLCKQNAGALAALIVLPILAVQIGLRWRSAISLILPIACGIGVGVAGLLYWARFVSDWDKFVLHAFTIPLSIGSGRLPHTAGGIVRMLSTVDSYVFPVAAVSVVILLASAIGLAVSWRIPRREGILTASVLAPAILIHQSIFRATALNEAENGLPFFGLAFGLAVAILLDLFWNRTITVAASEGSLCLEAPAVRALLAVPLGLSFLLTFVSGLQADRKRVVHGFKNGAVFQDYLNIPRANHVVWGQPAQPIAGDVKQREFEELYKYLAAQSANFFVYQDATILYGLTGRTPPQPVLFFLEGHSYRRQDIPQLDDEILASLRANNVRIFVRETAHSMPETTPLESFPKLHRWLTTDFHLVKTIGIYEIWERAH